MPRGNPFARRYNLVMHAALFEAVTYAAECAEVGLAEWCRQAFEEALTREGITLPDGDNVLYPPDPVVEGSVV